METTNAIVTSVPVHQHWNATLLAIFPWVLLLGAAVLILMLLPKAQDYMMAIRPVTIDGLIVTFLGGFIYSQSYLASEEAFKYVEPYLLFWFKYGFGLGAAVLIALKSFRSTEYANHLQQKKDLTNGKVTTTDTEIHITAQSPPPVDPAQPTGK